MLQYLIEVDFARFQAHLRAHERSLNAGALTAFDATRNSTVWTVAGNVVGESAGPVGSGGAHWAVVGLTPRQHGLVVDQLSNNDVASDDELVEHFWREGGLCSADARATLLERPRCLREPLYEPLFLLRTGVGA